MDTTQLHERDSGLEKKSAHEIAEVRQAAEPGSSERSRMRVLAPPSSTTARTTRSPSMRSRRLEFKDSFLEPSKLYDLTKERVAILPSAQMGGVRDGIEELMPRLWRFCHMLTANSTTAADLAQSTCLRALEREEQFQVETKLDSWLFRIAQSIWFNEMRATRIRRGKGLVPVEEAELVAPVNLESNIFFTQVFAQVMALPEAQRITVGLVYVEGYTYQEASALLGIPVGTVMSRLAAARGRLAKTLSGDAEQHRSCEQDGVGTHIYGFRTLN
jgi:RNA polymerase sigma-70 factor, ECF subfamily